MSSPKSACLILGFARVEGVLSVLASAIKAECPRIYISLDGSDDLSINQNQERLLGEIAKLSEISNSKFFIRRSTKNLGVAGGVISGIDWFFQNEDFGIILEDDLEISDDFFQFVSMGKKFLETNSNYLMISGCRFSPSENEISITNYPLIWGWATSKNNWLFMRQSIMSGPSFAGSLSCESSYWLAGALRVKYGYLDTWDIPLVLMFRQKDKYCIIPPVNLISNIGIDSFAAHTKSDQFPLGHPIGKLSEVVLSSLKLNSDSFEDQNAFLKTHVYRIRFRHLFSVIKFYLEYLRKPATYGPLSSRIL